MPKLSDKQKGVLNHNSPVAVFAGLVDKFDSSPAILDAKEHTITADEETGDAFDIFFDTDVKAVLEGYTFDPTDPSTPAVALDLSKLTGVSGAVASFAGNSLTADTVVLLVARCAES